MRAGDLDVCRVVIAWSPVDEVIVFRRSRIVRQHQTRNLEIPGSMRSQSSGAHSRDPLVSPPEPLAAGLAKRGVRPGEFVLLHLENSIEAMLRGIRKKRKRH